MNLASKCYSAIGGGGADVIGEFLHWLVERHRLDSPLRVLDVGCGPGRMFPKFRELNWSVRAVEPDPDFNEAATHAALAVGYEPPERAGFTELDGCSDFDLVTAINDSFSHLLTSEARAGGLLQAFAALRPGGVLFIEVPNFLWILKNYQAPVPLRAAVPNGEVVLQREHEIDYHAATFTTIEHYRLLCGGSEQRVRLRHVYAMTSLPELEHQLRSAGFANVETYGSYAARAAEPISGSRMLIAAERPARGAR